MAPGLVSAGPSGRGNMLAGLKFVFTVGTAVAALVSGIFWIKAAHAKVNSLSENVGVGYGGVPVNVKDHTGTVVDFLQTYALQSKWNAKAAWTSGIAGFLGSVAAVLQLFVP
jgi:hypothetical protein